MNVNIWLNENEIFYMHEGLGLVHGCCVDCQVVKWRKKLTLKLHSILIHN